MLEVALDTPQVKTPHLPRRVPHHWPQFITISGLRLLYIRSKRSRSVYATTSCIYVLHYVPLWTKSLWSYPTRAPRPQRIISYTVTSTILKSCVVQPTNSALLVLVVACRLIHTSILSMNCFRACSKLYIVFWPSGYTCSQYHGYTIHFSLPDNSCM